MLPGKDVERNGLLVSIVSIWFDVLVWAVEVSLPLFHGHSKKFIVFVMSFLWSIVVSTTSL